MIAKYLLLAVVAVALAQCQDNGFEYEVQRALYRLKGLNTGAEKGLQAAFEEININRKYLVMKSDDFLEKGKYVREQVRQTVLRVALELENKAEELKKPHSVIECIEKAEKIGLDKVDASVPKFAAEIKKLQTTASEAIDVAAKPLPQIKAELPNLYKKSEKEIQSCKDSNCLRSTMSKIRQEYNALHTRIGNVFRTVEIAFAAFMRNASIAFGNYKKFLNIIEDETIQGMNKCLK